jgi:uncharacterized protein
MKIKASLGIALLILLSNFNVSSKKGANASSDLQHAQVLPVTAKAKIAGKTIKLEVAQTQEQQSLGLMFRKSLAYDHGMLFPFESERLASFWMKNVSISLDMVFLNDDRVVGIAVNVPPCTTQPCPIYGPNALVNQVIELRGGRAQELGVKAGDTIIIESLNLP